MRIPVFDAHCHIFNAQYLLDEAANMLWDFMWGRYPYQKKDALSEISQKHKHIEKLKLLIRWLFELREALSDSEEENMNLLIDKGSEAWKINRSDMKIIPLMMDIFYMFAYNVTDKESVDVSINQINKANFNIDLFEKELNDCFTEEIECAGSNGKHHRVRKWIRRVIDELKDRVRDRDGVDWSLGYDDEIKSLKRLVEKYPEKLYPFFAVDPRRRGIINYIRTSGVVGKSGPFYGIKLYPYLGYHPACEELKPIYDFCAEKDLPITTHTAVTGFPPEKLCSNVRPDFGNPLNYEQVIKQYGGKLKINFAHFGHGDDTWGKTIVSLMEQYNNVYSDLSCYTIASDIDNFKEKFWSNDIVKERTMFGSDFDVMYFTNPGNIDLVKYYLDFSERFSNKELDMMASILPQKFLGL